MAPPVPPRPPVRPSPFEDLSPPPPFGGLLDDLFALARGRKNVTFGCSRSPHGWAVDSEFGDGVGRAEGAYFSAAYRPAHVSSLMVAVTELSEAGPRTTALPADASPGAVVAAFGALVDRYC